MRKITLEESIVLRRKVIEEFVDEHSEYYHSRISMYISENPLAEYKGYYWDCLKKPDLITQYDILEEMTEDEYFLFTDIQSYEMIQEEAYKKIDKISFYKITKDNLINQLNDLPSDIYLCNRDLSILYCLTHEYIDNNRYCLKSIIKQ
jgi:hypothetical protein